MPQIITDYENMTDPSPRQDTALSSQQLQRLVRDLNVQHVELEVQNLELRKAHRILEESRNNYANLYDSSPIGYATWDSQGIIQEINLTGAALLGAPRPALIGKSFLSYVIKPDVFLKHLRRCARVKTQVVTELALQPEQGDERCVQLYSVPNSSDDHQHYRTALTDITLRKQAETALLKSHEELEERIARRTEELLLANHALSDEIAERNHVQEALARQAQQLLSSEQSLREQTDILQSVLDSMADGVVVVDQHGKHILSNPAARRLRPLARNQSGATGDVNSHGIYLPDQSTPYPPDELPLARAIRGEEVTNAEGFVQHPEWPKGAWLSANARPLRDATGAVRGGVVVFRDITERKHAEQRLLYLAQYDLLTGLPNRNLLRDCLSQAMTRAKHDQHSIALMFLDLDNFKDINDAAGHWTGDLVLQGVAERFSACLREGDTLARLGGDEFTILLENIGADHAAKVAIKILMALRQPFTIEGREFFVTASIGITLYPDDDANDDVDSLLKKTDIAMYEAKARGRNNYQFHRAALQQRIVERINMGDKLRNALNKGELILHYQPLVELATGKIIAAEALLRWQSPELGLVFPSQFIGLAEETGHIVAIGEWVLATACAQNKAWQDEGLPHLQMSVNLSARQFRQSNLTGMIRRILRTTDLAPAYLDLEITEGLLMENIPSVASVMAELKSMGLHISVDDFGTGYSSLSYLKRFPLNTLKIDQSFIRNLSTDPADIHIASAIIALAKSLQLKIVAEGVETEEQLALLRARHCDVIQGYLFSYPLSADALADLLRRGVGLSPA